MNRWVTGCLLGGLSLLASVPRALADQTSDASEHFAAGRAALKRGDYAGACRELDDSQRLDPSLGTVLNLAVCEEGQGHLLRALSWLASFARSAPVDDERRARVAQLQADLESRLPKLWLSVDPDEVTDLRLSVDEEARAFGRGQRLLLDPGRHRIDVLADGYEPASLSVELREGEHSERRVALTPITMTSSAPSSAPTTTVPAASSVRAAAERQPLPASFYVALGTAVAGTLTVVESAIVVRNEHATVDAHCQDKVCDETGLAAGRRGKTFAIVNTVAWPVAVAGASVAVYLGLWGRGGAKPYGLRLSGATGGGSLLFLQGTFD